MPRLSQVISSERSTVSARSTSRADRPSERARTANRAPRGILSLDREQALGDRLGRTRRRASEELRGEPLVHHPEFIRSSAEARCSQEAYAGFMSYATAEARQQLLDAVAQAIDEIAVALAALGGAYDLLDEQNADTLEQKLFRPTQLAYGRAQRTYSGFAERSGLPARSFEPASPGLPSHGVRGFVEIAGDAVEQADGLLATLQDSMMPVEVGDVELRAGLAEVRTLLGQLSGQARQLMRTWGR